MSAPFIALYGGRVARPSVSRPSVLRIREEFINKLSGGPPYSSPTLFIIFKLLESDVERVPNCCTLLR